MNTIEIYTSQNLHIIDAPDEEGSHLSAFVDGMLAADEIESEGLESRRIMDRLEVRCR